MNKSSNRYKYIFISLLIIQIIYLPFTYFYPGLPGWKMFAETKKISFEIYDQHNNKIDHLAYLISPVYSFSRSQAIGLTSFICKKTKESYYTLILSPKEKYEFKRPLCLNKKL